MLALQVFGRGGCEQNLPLNQVVKSGPRWPGSSKIKRRSKPAATNRQQENYQFQGQGAWLRCLPKTPATTLPDCVFRWGLQQRFGCAAPGAGRPCARPGCGAELDPYGLTRCLLQLGPGLQKARPNPRPYCNCSPPGGNGSCNRTKHGPQSGHARRCSEHSQS